MSISKFIKLVVNCLISQVGVDAHFFETIMNLFFDLNHFNLGIELWLLTKLMKDLTWFKILLFDLVRLLHLVLRQFVTVQRMQSVVVSLVLWHLHLSEIFSSVWGVGSNKCHWKFRSLVSLNSTNLLSCSHCRKVWCWTCYRWVSFTSHYLSGISILC